MCLRNGTRALLAAAAAGAFAIGCGQAPRPPGGGMPPFPGACILATQPCLPTADHPTPRSEFAAVYDEVGRRMIVYGGSTAVSMGCNIATPIFVDDVYA